MSAQTEQFDADVEAVEAEAPVRIRIAEKVYVGQRTTVIEKQAMVDAGFEQAYDFSLTLLASKFSSPEKPPEVNSEMEVFDIVRNEWVSFRVVSSVPDQLNVAIVYALSENT